MDRIRVGVVGCGEIAQVMHLRFLSELPEFELAALCDLSESVLATLGARYGIRHLYTSYEDLLQRAPVDAVLVATPDHGGPALAVLSAGKHLLLEKPVSLNLADATEIAAAADRTGRVAMMGYVRVYDPGYEFLREQVAGMRDLRLARSHDFLGDFGHHAALFDIVRPAAEENLAGTSANIISDKVRRSLGQAAGPDPNAQDLYWELLMSATHDLSVLRDLLGPPREVAYSRAAGRKLFAAVAYERVLCHLEWDMTGGYEWWDQELAVYGGDAACTAAFADPYIPYLTTRTTVRHTVHGHGGSSDVFVSNEPAFRREWSHFADCIRGDKRPRTTVRGGLDDIELCRELVRSGTPG